MAEIRTIEINKQSFSRKSFMRIGIEYLLKHQDLPVLIADSSAKFPHDKLRVKAYFHDDILRVMCKNMTKHERDIIALLTYGYIGNSRGGKNGLILIPERDQNLAGVVERFQERKYIGFCESINFNLKNTLYPVKIVTHRKSGERLVGVLDKNSMEAVLYDIRTYQK